MKTLFSFVVAVGWVAAGPTGFAVARPTCRLVGPACVTTAGERDPLTNAGRAGQVVGQAFEAVVAQPPAISDDHR